MTLVTIKVKYYPWLKYLSERKIFRSFDSRGQKRGFYLKKINLTLKWHWRSCSRSNSRSPLNSPSTITSEMTLTSVKILLTEGIFRVDTLIEYKWPQWRSRSNTTCNLSTYPNVKFSTLSIAGVKKAGFYLKKLRWPWNDLEGQVQDQIIGHHWIPRWKLLRKWPWPFLTIPFLRKYRAVPALFWHPV